MPAPDKDEQLNRAHHPRAQDEDEGYQEIWFPLIQLWRHRTIAKTTLSGSGEFCCNTPLSDRVNVGISAPTANRCNNDPYPRIWNCNITQVLR